MVLLDSSDPAPTLDEIARRIRPTVLASERTLEVPEVLGDLFPLGGIARGSRVSLRGQGATSLCMAMLATASQQGSWIAVVGVRAFGWAAAARAGWCLNRTVFVDEPPGSQWGTVMATLLDALDVVIVSPQRSVGATDARRLAARSRERGSIIVDLEVGDPARPADGADAAGGARPRSRWPIEADLTLTTRVERWGGIVVGSGLLAERDLVVETSGRRGAARQRSLALVVAPDGSLRRAEPAVAGAVPGGPVGGVERRSRRHLRSVG